MEEEKNVIIKGCK